jgi:hypothetical protein
VIQGWKAPLIGFAVLISDSVEAARATEVDPAARAVCGAPPWLVACAIGVAAASVAVVATHHAYATFNWPSVIFSALVLSNLRYRLVGFEVDGMTNASWRDANLNTDTQKHTTKSASRSFARKMHSYSALETESECREYP